MHGTMHSKTSYFLYAGSIYKLWFPVGSSSARTSLPVCWKTSISNWNVSQKLKTSSNKRCNRCNISHRQLVKKDSSQKTSPSFDKIPALSTNSFFQTLKAFKLSGLSVFWYKESNQRNFTERLCTGKGCQKTPCGEKFIRYLWSEQFFIFLKKTDVWCFSIFLFAINQKSEAKKTRNILVYSNFQ